MAKGEFPSGFYSMFDNLIPVTIGNIIGGLLIVLLHPKVEERIARLLMKRNHHH
jgi:formate/nitrite transporter FocA (FNT family)